MRLMADRGDLCPAGRAGGSACGWQRSPYLPRFATRFWNVRDASAPMPRPCSARWPCLPTRPMTAPCARWAGFQLTGHRPACARHSAQACWERTATAGFSFRHVLAGRAMYEAIPGPAARTLHLRAGRALEGCAAAPAVRLAHHYRVAGAAAKWARYAEQAADLALASGDEATAVALLCDLIVDGGLPVCRAIRLTDKITFTSLPDPGAYAGLVGALRSLLSNGIGEPGRRSRGALPAWAGPGNDGGVRGEPLRAGAGGATPDSRPRQGGPGHGLARLAGQPRHPGIGAPDVDSPRGRCVGVPAARRAPVHAR